MRCAFCRTDLDTVHWAFDGVGDQTVRIEEVESRNVV